MFLDWNEIFNLNWSNCNNYNFGFGKYIFPQSHIYTFDSHLNNNFYRNWYYKTIFSIYLANYWNFGWFFKFELF